jgi:hypothetical protein
MQGTRRRERTPPRVNRTASVTTTTGRTYEVTERQRAPSTRQVEAAERRRSKDSVLETVASTTKKQRAGRPPKGQSGPKPGSVRYVAAASGGLASKSSISRAGKQLAEEGAVRDRRRQNGRESNLSEAQMDAILELMYDEFEKRNYVNYVKVRDFAELVQTDDDICAVCSAKPVAQPWRPSKSWIGGYVKRWRISSHKATGKASSRSRPTMEAEEEWVDHNYSQFNCDVVVSQDESSFVWGAPPYRTLATSDGFGAQLHTEDKWEKVRTTLVLAVRSTENPGKQILTPLCIPSHDCALSRDSTLTHPRALTATVTLRLTLAAYQLP